MHPLHHTSCKIYRCFATHGDSNENQTTSCEIYRCFATYGDSNENQTTSCEIYRCFATSRRLKRNPTILQEFVPLTCNYRSNKRQFSLLPSNLRGRQVSYHLSIVLCENLCNILFFNNELSYIFINSVFYYHCEQLRAHGPDK